MELTWVKIDSWHAWDESTSRTVCGREVEKADIEARRDTLPVEKSCESCLRIVARAADTEKV